MKITTKRVTFFLLIAVLFITKLLLNNLLLAENGDTYDFFKIAYFIRNFDWTVESKRMPLLPLLLSFANPENFVQWGRIVINFFYFGSIMIFYLYFKEIFRLIGKQIGKKSIKIFNYQLPIISFYSLLASAVFATNIIILENSFYVLADTIFLFWNLLFLYILKRYGTSKYIWLSIISGLAFYTRPEGALLFLILGLSIFFEIFSSKNSLFKSNNYKLLIIKGLKITLVAAILVSPYLIRNQVLYGELFYSGYLEDKAGFIFNTQTSLLRLSNFLYGLGGVWLLPTLYLMVTSSNLNFKLRGGRINTEIITFILYTITLFLWGPYIRLYTIPLTLLIVLIFLQLSNVKPTKSRIKDIFITGALYIFSTGLYIWVVQKYNYSDLGYRKISKGLAIIGFIPLLMYFYLYIKKFINKNILLILFTTTLVFLNIFIFIDKFRFIRYKYITIKRAVEVYLNKYENKGKLAYSNESGIEGWYLKDFDNDFYYSRKSTSVPFKKWVINNNVRYIIQTDEFGYEDYITGIGLLNNVEHEVIERFKSPFFYGDTRIIKIELKD